MSKEKAGEALAEIRKLTVMNCKMLKKIGENLEHINFQVNRMTMELLKGTDDKNR